MTGEGGMVETGGWPRRGNPQRGGDVGTRPDLVLASMNVHGGRGADGSPFDVVTVCLQLKADVIVLQEAWRPDGEPDPVAVAAQELGARVIRADLLSRTNLRILRIAGDPTPGRWGLAVLTTLPVVGYERADLGRFPGDLSSRAAQLVTIVTPGGPALRVVNTHLTHRFFSPVQLMRLVRRLAVEEIPTVIVGDLNMPGPVSGLAVGYSPAVNGRTFPAHRPLIQLDHMLTSRDVRARDGEVLPPGGSDHRAIRARVQVL